MIVAMLILHGLLAVVLLGALTHQSLAVMPLGTSPGPRSFFDRFRRVNSPAYATPIVILFVLTAMWGGLVYPQYRIEVRPTLEDYGMSYANGVFEIKEHLISIGLGVLPGYWLVWRQPLEPAAAAARRYTTWLLAFFAWWGFLAGHVLNNIKGLLP